MNLLPHNDSELLKRITNSKVVGFTFCGMKNCNESLAHQNGKYSEATWGVILHFEDKTDVGFTWDEDSKVGDPFYIHLIQAEKLMESDLLETQTASRCHPWSKYVGKYVIKATVHSYQTNYRNLESWYSVPWGIELEFNGSHKMLVGALPHGDFLEYMLCADEVVIIFDSDLINSVIQTHSSFKTEWPNDAKATYYLSY